MREIICPVCGQEIHVTATAKSANGRLFHMECYEAVKRILAKFETPETDMDLLEYLKGMINDDNSVGASEKGDEVAGGTKKDARRVTTIRGPVEKDSVDS